ncbi:17136_t:CDS:2 [Gigaspora margarita]|uniref:17136_t:CDS:1 n=1 Tax=Gigaspora margarita TaxID=4874 RepID=A0ABN7UX23_GIGMA|nr:17136_t:CDS:2 [Gigaspora margarita]
MEFSSEESLIPTTTSQSSLSANLSKNTQPSITPFQKAYFT